MAERYNHKEVEAKWQKRWEESQAFKATDSINPDVSVGVPTKASGKKTYLLIEFPYPSGEGLHVGHIRSWTALDIVARKRRMQGENVLYPIGWDAFGLPAENYALKTGIHPKISTQQNTDNFRRQIKSLGLSFDWSREVNTTDPKYYKWTQWIFLQLFKHGLAYKAKTTINWCPSCKIGLANEEVVDGACERCGSPVEKREKEQWMLAITKYAKRLYDDLETVDYIEAAKAGQRNWIGPSEGAEISFLVPRLNLGIKVFTTRPDTLFGATYMVLAPEHLLVGELLPRVENKKAVEEYIAQAKKKTEIERTAEGKEKTGVELKGVKAINPATREEIPMYVADYVLAGYGTGAIMAVPAHDERDLAFAKKFGLPISDAELVDSKKITEEVGGTWVVNYKLRDWVFSRQRYWGEPIPMIFCEKDGWVPVPEADLPVELPQVEKYQPSDSGESPLANIAEWVNTKCPTCGGPARRETDVMPNWAGSSWYYLRYCDPENNKEFASPEKLKYWSPVDWYNGGMEHTTLHLLYSRFWHKFLYDQKLVPTPEPYAKRTSHGLILAEGGEKMSKSKGNVVNPDGIVESHGADALRLHEMFLGPLDQSVVWNTSSIAGVARFLERIWRLQIESKGPPLNQSALSKPNLDTLLHQTVKKVTEDIEALKMNTAVSTLMIFLKALEDLEKVPRSTYEVFIKLLYPFAPHMVSELGEKYTIDISVWPTYDEQKVVKATSKVAVQINGKTRGSIELAVDVREGEALALARANPAVSKWLAGQEEVRVVFVPGKILNIVLRNSGVDAV